MEGPSQTARCVNCRTDVRVPDAYAHGDHIKCGTCGTQHKVRRGEVLRLVLADVAPLKESLLETQARVENLETELRHARASIGIGTSGLGVGLAYLIYQVGFNEALLSSTLAWHSLGVALGAGIVLEVCNYLFLAKHQAIKRLSTEIANLTAEGRQIQQKIRDASRS
jgi:hypothetical protein